MRIYRRVLNISWTTNEELLRRMGTGKETVRQFKTRKLQSYKLKTRKLQYLGHLIRHNTSQLQLIEGKMEDRRSRGRPRTTWITDLTNNTGAKYYQLKRAAEDQNDGIRYKVVGKYQTIYLLLWTDACLRITRFF